MTNWKYTDATDTVASRTLDDGRMESMLASALPEGTEVLPADPPPPVVITSVTMRQARLALLSAGLLTQVEAAIAAIPEESARMAAQINWEYAATVDKGDVWVENLSTALGLTSEELDNLFNLAATL